jgi:hypothetical protein
MHPAPIGRGSCVLAREHPRAKQQSPEWQAATEALLMAAGDRGPLMHAHIGMMRALNPKANTGIRFIERETLGTAKAQEG